MSFYRRWSSDAGGGGRAARPDGPSDPGARTHARTTRAEVDELLDAFLEAEPEADGE